MDEPGDPRPPGRDSGVTEVISEDAIPSGANDVIVAGRFLGPLDWARIILGTGLVLIFFLVVAIAGIGWLQGKQVADFLPVITAVTTVLAAATGWFFTERRR